MFKHSGLIPAFLSLVVALASQTAWANGDIGEHVNDLKAHLDEYSEETRDMLTKVDSLVARYGDDKKSVDSAQLIQFWEEVKLHGAVEVNHVPLYAGIWQGLYGLKEAMDKKQPLDRVRQRQRDLERALWQGLGAVKMAAQTQQQGPQTSASAEQDTMKRIDDNLDVVAEQHAEGNNEAALELVHATYGNLFEGVEGELIEQDADLVVDLEKDFNVTLPKALQSSSGSVRDVIAAMKKKLDRAEELLIQARENKKDVF